MNVSYVTAFHPLRHDDETYKNNIRHDIRTYLDNFDKFASTGVPIVVFLDKECQLQKEYPNVKVVPSQMGMDWIPKEVNLPKNRHPIKDSRDFLVLMLHKMKYMNEALAYCDTPYLAWIDFGISHIIKYPRTTFQKLVHLQSFSKPLTTIMSPGCWGQNNNFVKDSVYWRFCGGFFLGPREVFPRAYERQTELVKTYLPTLTWEVNYWALMDDMFSWYSANHDDSILMNFPWGPSIQRITNDGYYVGGHRKVSAGGPIESYVYSLLPHGKTVIFQKTDMLVEPDTYRRMRESMSWHDPAIHMYDATVDGLVCVDTSRNLRDNVLLLPTDDITFEKGLVFDHVLPDWNTRKSQVVWRGASSGCEWPSLRLRTVRELEGQNVKFVTGGWPENDSQIPQHMFGEKLTIDEQLQYKYMLSIDGNGAASNIEWIFASGCVPIFVVGNGVDFWFRNQLQDGVNCILASPETIVERVRWLVEHDEDAQRISQNALKFGRRLFTPESQRAYLRSFFQTTAGTN